MRANIKGANSQVIFLRTTNFIDPKGFKNALLLLSLNQIGFRAQILKFQTQYLPFTQGLRLIVKPMLLSMDLTRMYVYHALIFFLPLKFSIAQKIFP